jgi:muramoyltetrapeptide carboxypeptidase
VESNVIAEEVVASLGLVPKRMPAAARQTMYLAGTDEERAADLNAAFRDPSVDAVWCIRGGYGSGRLLPLLDWEAIRKNPKPLLGYSDITALLNGFYARTGLVTFHAPNCSENISDYSLSELKKVLFSTGAAGVVASAPPAEPKEGFVDREDRLRRISPGTGRGRLVGGNISVFSTLVGTPWEPPLAGSILFLEEVGEEPYRIDRWLTHLVLTGRLSKCAGIVFGKFKDCGPAEKGSFQGTWTWQEVAADRFGKLGVPVLAGLRFGHVTDKATLPVGVLAELDVALGTMTLLEPAVT